MRYKKINILLLTSFFVASNTMFGSILYTLTEIADETTITTEDFVVTKYIGDISIGNVTPVKYLLTFNNTLGDSQNEVGTSPATRYFKWKVDENGNKYLANTGLADSAKDITAYSSNNVRVDTTTDWTDGNSINNSFLYRGTAGVILEGGAVYNSEGKSINKINGDFIANYVESTETSTDNILGGGIYNKGIIESIGGNFIANYASSLNTVAGGAIYNTGSLNSIIGHFISNKINNGSGGAIYNVGTIDYIKGDFIGNKAFSDGSYGGAIRVDGGEIKRIEGDFINNYSGTGGAIYGSISQIEGDFIANHSNYSAGAIKITVGNSFIVGNFISNHSDGGMGGGIYSVACNAMQIVGNFIGNYISPTPSGRILYCSGSGGAVFLNTTNSEINGNFIGNYIYGYSPSDIDRASNFSVNGGAIYISATAHKNNIIIGNFSNNYVLAHGNKGSEINSLGGAICSNGDVSNIIGDFIRNYVLDNVLEVSHLKAGGGAILLRASFTIENITGDFLYNYISASGESIGNGTSYGGAICNEGIIGNIEGNFIKNYVHNSYSTSTSVSSNISTKGGAIYNEGIITLKNSEFSNNYASVSVVNAITLSNGGAIYNSGTINFNVTERNYIKNTGNYTEKNGVKSDLGGGFLYMADGTLANFNIEKNSNYVIGDGCEGYDSIASENTNSIINKNGNGELIVNSSMEYYIGTLNINEGKMSVNNKLGASRIVINNGTTLSAKISGEKIFTNTDLNFSNDGTLLLIAGENLAGGNYSVSAFATPEEVYFGNVKTYGGTFDHATGCFIVKDALNIIEGSSVVATVQSNGRLLVSGATEESTSVMMSFNSVSDVTVNAVTETTTIDNEFNEIVNKVVPETLLLAESFDFDVENLGITDSVTLSFYVGEGYDISQFTIYHKEDGGVWELANIENLNYDGEHLSFSVDGFSSYGYIVAVPEPAEWAVIFGAVALGFVMYRRRK